MKSGKSCRARDGWRTGWRRDAHSCRPRPLRCPRPESRSRQVKYRSTSLRRRGDGRGAIVSARRRRVVARGSNAEKRRRRMRKDSATRTRAFCSRLGARSTSSVAADPGRRRTRIARVFSPRGTACSRSRRPSERPRAEQNHPRGGGRARCCFSAACVLRMLNQIQRSCALRGRRLLVKFGAKFISVCADEIFLEGIGYGSYGLLVTYF